MKNEINTKVDYDMKREIDNAIDIFKTYYDNYKDMDIEDAISEIADSCTPIYYWDIAQYMAHNFELLHIETTENQPIYQIVQAELYNMIYNGLCEFIDSKEFKKIRNIKPCKN